MKKKLSVVLILVIVTSMLCINTLSVFASLSPSNGLGIVDDTNYYIYIGDNPIFNKKHYMVPMLGLSGGSVITENNIQASDVNNIWRVDKQSDGTFKIISLAGNGTYLSAINSPIVKTDTSDHDDFVNFEICRVDNGNVNGKYTIKNDFGYVSMGTTSVVLQNTPNEFSYWSFVAVNKGWADYFGYTFDNIDTTEYSNYVISQYDSMGYNGTQFDNYRNASDILENMKYNDITIFAGDGEAGALIVDPNSIDSMGKISADYRLSGYDIQAYVSDLPSNSLAKSRCIIYLSSYSGCDAIGEDGNEYNLVNETYNKGAHYVLGFTKELTEQEIELWLEAFIFNVENGCTINNAVSLANLAAGFTTDTNEDPSLNSNIYFVGDGTQHLNF